MTEENNIEQEISDKFYEYSKNYDIHKWHDFIDKIDLSKLKSTLIISEIDLSLDLENWNLEQLNFEFIILNKPNCRRFITNLMN